MRVTHCSLALFDCCTGYRVGDKMVVSIRPIVLVPEEDQSE